MTTECHGLTQHDTMFSVKHRPWHGLGSIITNAPTLEEGIKLAGLDWQVYQEPIWTQSGVQCDSNKAITRDLPDGKRHVLGVVGMQYQPLQNLDAFKWFEPFVENELVQLETAGSLFTGKKIFVLAKLNNENLAVADNDEIEQFILLSNSHDGSTSVRIGFTPIRVVCNNTLSLAHKTDQSQLIRVKHSSQVETNLIELRETMDLVNQQFMTTVENYRYLASRDICTADLQKYVKQVFSSRKVEDIISAKEEVEKIEEERKRLMARIEEIFELEPAKNMWTAYNSVNSYLNHHRNKDTEKRYNAMWFGQSGMIDKKALNLALHY